MPAGAAGVAPTSVDLEGPFLLLRLVDATATDVTALARTLGLEPVPASQRADRSAQPDLIVSFEPAGPRERATAAPPRLAAEVTVIGGNVRSGGTTLTIQDVARGSRLGYPRGGGIPPELGELITLCAAEAGGLPIHATAQAFGRRGVVVTGPSGAGKTGVLLAALARGAALVAAEHVVVASDGLLHGRRQAVRARPRHRHQLSPSARATHARRLAAWQRVSSMTAALTGVPRFPARVAERLRDIVRDRAIADIPPDAFPATPDSVVLDTLVLVQPTAGNTGVAISALTAEEAAGQLTAMLRSELARLRSAADVVSMVTNRPACWSLDHTEAAYRKNAELLLNGRRLLLVRTPEGELPSSLAAELMDHIIESKAATP